MYWWWPRSWCRAFIYTIKSVSLIHGLDSRSFLMELVFAACCFVFPVWALSLQSYEGDHEDDFDFLWKLWLDTAIKILLSLQINGLLYGGILVLNRGLFLLWAFPRSLSLRWIENRGINDDIPSQGPGDCWFFRAGSTTGLIVIRAVWTSLKRFLIYSLFSAVIAFCPWWFTNEQPFLWSGVWWMLCVRWFLSGDRWRHNRRPLLSPHGFCMAFSPER